MCQGDIPAVLSGDWCPASPTYARTHRKTPRTQGWLECLSFSEPLADWHQLQLKNPLRPPPISPPSGNVLKEQYVWYVCARVQLHEPSFSSGSQIMLGISSPQANSVPGLETGCYGTIKHRLHCTCGKVCSHTREALPEN